MREHLYRGKRKDNGEWVTGGEFTGLYDKKGTLIFEGVYEDCSFVGVDQNDARDEIVCWNDIEVIGNIHDNPELLEASHD